MLLRVVHQTTYRYGDPVTLGHNQVWLTPRSFARQRTVSAEITVVPRPPVRRTWTDAFGNEVDYFTLEEPHSELAITLKALVEMLAPCERPEGCRLTWEETRDLLASPGSEQLPWEAVEFTYDSPYVRRSDDVRAYAAPSFPRGRPLLDAVLDLTHRIHAEFKYDSTATTVHTPISETLKQRRGVCQDFAHLQIACLRSFGIAARYVSGYLVTRPPPGKTKLVGADASHAWIAVYFPGAGWVEFDPTNDRLGGMDHITLAWGRDYSDVAPIKGLFLGGGASSLRVSVDVSPVEARAGA